MTEVEVYQCIKLFIQRRAGQQPRSRVSSPDVSCDNNSSWRDAGILRYLHNVLIDIYVDKSIVYARHKAHSNCSSIG